MKKALIGGMCLALLLSMAACGNELGESSAQETTGSGAANSTTESGSAPAQSSRYYDTIPDEEKQMYADNVICDGEPGQKDTKTAYAFALPLLKQSDKIPADNPITQEQAHKIFWNLLEKGFRIEKEVNGCSFPHIEEKISLVWDKETDGTFCPYHLVKDKNIKTKKDVWTYIYTVYTPKAAFRQFGYGLSSQMRNPRFLEYNGHLYYQDLGTGYNWEYLPDSIKIKAQYKNVVVMEVTQKAGDDSTKPCCFVMRRTKDGWRLDTSIYEAEEKDYIQQFSK